MSLDKKIIKEIQRYRSIDKYIMEQALDAAPPPPPDPGADLGAIAPPPVPDAGAGAPPPPAPTTPQPIDIANDPDVEKIDDDGESEEKKDDSNESGELDITELVDSQKSIQTKQDEYFENLFGQLNKLESRLGEMDQIMSKLNTLEAKIEKYREKTPQEKLELRTYDSYPFNQKLSDFFDDKQQDMQKSGKNEYVLTSDDVIDINPDEVKNTFNQDYEEDDSFDIKF